LFDSSSWQGEASRLRFRHLKFEISDLKFSERDFATRLLSRATCGKLSDSFFDWSRMPKFVYCSLLNKP